MDRGRRAISGIALATATALAMACGGRLAPEAPDGATGGANDASAAATAPDVAADGGSAEASKDGGADATLEAASDAMADSPEEAPSPDASAVGAPRPLAPLSTATVTSQEPTLHWQLAPASDGAKVDICHDRACNRPVVTFFAPGTSGSPPAPLAAGVYFWKLRGTSNGGIGSESSPTWEMFVGGRSAPVDTSWGSVPDVDGDGIADAITASVGALDAGTVYVYEGSATELTAATTLDPPAGGAPDYYGAFLASAGDIDGDGFPEVLVNTSYEVWMFRGGAAGVSTEGVLVTPAATNQRVQGAAGVGDVDGDGYADIAVGVNVNPMIGGTVTIYRGGPAGLTASPIPLTIGDFGFGSSLASTDVNGDGYGDFVTAATQGLYVYEGGPGGPRNTPVLIAFSEYAQNGYFVSSAGDVNGDGFGDVLSLETPYRSSGPNALLYFGSAAGPGSEPLVTSSIGVGSAGVGVVAGVGDVNGDGYADYAMIPAYEATGIYLALGGASGPTLLSQSWALPTNSVGAITFGAAGDVNGDGVDDVLVGDLGANATYVYLGDKISDLQSMPAQTLVGGGSPL